jgi:hypothetical protein
MNKLEVGKSYETVSRKKLYCLSVSDKRLSSKAAICEFSNGEVSLYSKDGIGYGLPIDDRIKWPVEFKAGQLVMVRDTDDQEWGPRVYKYIGSDGEFYAGHDIRWRQFRHLTDAEWLEFREGRK